MMTMRTELALSNTAASRPYTDAVRFGDLLFISGIVALDEDNNIVAPGDVAGQADYILATIGKILGQAGGDFADILRVTIYLTDVNNRGKINPVRQRYFGGTKPASTLVEVSALMLPGLLVEIEAVAGLPPAS